MSLSMMSTSLSAPMLLVLEEEQEEEEAVVLALDPRAGNSSLTGMMSSSNSSRTDLLLLLLPPDRPFVFVSLTGIRLMKWLLFCCWLVWDCSRPVPPTPLVAVVTVVLVAMLLLCIITDSVWLWKRGLAIGGVWNGWIETPTVDVDRKKNKTRKNSLNKCWQWNFLQKKDHQKRGWWRWRKKK